MEFRGVLARNPEPAPKKREIHKHGQIKSGNIRL